MYFYFYTFINTGEISSENVWRSSSSLLHTSSDRKWGMWPLYFSPNNIGILNLLLSAARYNTNLLDDVRSTNRALYFSYSIKSKK